MKTYTILVVDDDSDDVEMLEEALQTIDNNFQIVAKENGFKALQWMASTDEKPQYIFLDLNMPPLNGFQTLTKLKANEDWMNIPVIIYTTSNFKEDKDRCITAGASCFVTKPSKLDDLVKTISLVLKKQWQLL